MKCFFLAAALIGLSTGAFAQAQPNQGGVSTPKYENSPFGSDWSKPYPQTGGQMYNDPRSQRANQPQRPYSPSACPGRFDHKTGACR
jgi:hypothetical protein